MTTLCHKNEFAHRMLTNQGCYTHQHVDADFDDGDAENGPGTWGSPAYDVYEGDSHDLIMDHTGLIVDTALIDWDAYRYFESVQREYEPAVATDAQTMLDRWVNDVKPIVSPGNLAYEINDGVRIEGYLHTDRQRFIFPDGSSATYSNHCLTLTK